MTARTWEWTLPGAPIAQARPRIARCGRRVHLYAEPKSAAWRRCAADFLRSKWDGPPLDEAVWVTLLAVLPRPKRLGVGATPLHTARPDVDNLAKAALDAITAAGVLRDDCLVTTLEVSKLYALPVEGPHLLISIGTFD